MSYMGTIVLRAEAFVPMASVIMRLPAEIGDYTDCMPFIHPSYVISCYRLFTRHVIQLSDGSNVGCS
jgi:hypothetical protein